MPVLPKNLVNANHFVQPPWQLLMMPKKVQVLTIIGSILISWRGFLSELKKPASVKSIIMGAALNHDTKDGEVPVEEFKLIDHALNVVRVDVEDDEHL